MQCGRAAGWRTVDHQLDVDALAGQVHKVMFVEAASELSSQERSVFRSDPELNHGAERLR